MFEPRGINEDSSNLENIDSQPIGEIVLGVTDPSSLTEEAFENSPELLFHGSSRPFTFSRDFDYFDMEYLKIDEGSSKTLGFAFYTTDREDAQDYSDVRAHYSQREVQPHITAVLPFQARCLDLRMQNDPKQNAPVPEDFIDHWINFYKSSLLPDKYEHLNPNSAFHLRRMDEDYLQYLSQMTHEGSSNLKRLLRTDMWPAPYWMYTFRDFMLDQGFDGLVINEGSEKDKDRSVTTYVFYNLDKIGTYETWHHKKEVEV